MDPITVTSNFECFNSFSPSPTRIKTTWSEKFADEKQFEITTRGPLAALARRQKCVSLVSDDMSYLDETYQLRRTSTPDASYSPFATDHETLSLCSSLLSCDPGLSPSSFVGPSAIDESESGDFQPQSDSQDLSSKRLYLGGRTTENAASYRPRSYRGTNSRLDEPLTPGAFCVTAQRYGETLLNKVVPSLRVNRYSSSEVLTRQIEALKIDEQSDSAADCTIGYGFRDTSSFRAHRPEDWSGFYDTPCVDTTVPRRTLITESSTSPFVRKWVYRARQEPASLYRNTDLCSKLPGYLITELREDNDEVEFD